MKLDFESIKNNASEKTLEKSKEYVNKFQKITIQGDIMRGQIQGSQKELYQVEVCCTDNNYLKSSCTCLAQMDFCKHAAALCLTYLSQSAAQTTTKKQDNNIPEQYILDMDETSLKEKLLTLLPEFPGLLEKLTEGSSLQIQYKDTQNNEEDWEPFEF